MAVVKRTNTNILKGINLRMEQLQALEGKVGWFEGAKYQNGTPVAYIATIQEYGYGPIPPRPFMRPTISEQKQKWKEWAAKGANAIISGKRTPMEVMELFMQGVQDDVRRKIESITAPKLSDITLGARKYRDEGKKVTGATIGEIAARLKAGTLDVSGVRNKPLEDTSTMIDNLNHTVDDAAS